MCDDKEMIDNTNLVAMIDNVDESILQSIVDIICEREDEIHEEIASLEESMRSGREKVKMLSLKSRRLRDELSMLLRIKCVNPYKTKHFTICECLNRGTLTTKITREGSRRKKERCA